MSCIHILGVRYKIGFEDSAPVPSERKVVCSSCQSSEIICRGIRHNKSGDVQTYVCKSCGKRFVGRTGFVNRRADPTNIARSLDLYFRGMSIRKVREYLEQVERLNVSHMTIYRWVTYYSRLAAQWMDAQGARTSDVWHIDETVINVNGRAIPPRNGHSTPPGPTKRYPVIYADPPWAWTKGTFVNRRSARAVEKEYQTMQPSDLVALPVGNWATEDAVLFLWTTGPKLPIALEVVRSWGFTYKTIGFTWVKRNRRTPGWFCGLGFYTRANAELCLVATKGSPSRMSASVRQIVESPVARHSEKPEEVRARIERLYGGPYLELFARRRAPNWDAWGLEAPTDSDLNPPGSIGSFPSGT